MKIGMLFLIFFSSASLGEEKPDHHIVYEHSLKFGKEDVIMEFYDREHGVRCYSVVGSHDIPTISCVVSK